MSDHQPALVMHHNTDVEDEPRREPAHRSPFGSLRDRLKKIQEDLHVDLKVPRWDNLNDGFAIYVRYRPIEAAKMQKALERREKQKPRPTDWQTLANCDVLIQCCIGVYAVQGEEPMDGEEDTRTKYSLRDGDEFGEWTKFDQDLAHSLGLGEDASRAVDVVRTLYRTDGDLMSAATALVRFSGIALPESETDFTNR